MILQNELLQIVIHVDKGAEITQFLYKPNDTDFIWRAPNELHNPAAFTAAGGNMSAPFFDHWSGGWFEVVPNNGPPCTYKGADLGFYAETINIPWNYQILEDSPERIAIEFWVKTYRTPFLLQKTLTIESGQPHLLIDERLSNIGNETVEFVWGHHPVIGPPFLDENCRISFPKSRVIVLDDEDGPGYRLKLHQESQWPFVEGVDGNTVDLRKVLPQDSGHMDNCYLTDFEEGWVAVTNTKKKVGFGLSWSSEVFRYLWLWQAYGGGAEYPWFGRAYQLGIEPWSGYPCGGLLESIKNQSAMQLQPGETLSAWLSAIVFESDKDVSKITKEGRVDFIS